jgi:hypothetical protein
MSQISRGTSSHHHHDPGDPIVGAVGLAAVIGSIISIGWLFSSALFAGIAALFAIAGMAAVGLHLQARAPDQHTLPKTLFVLGILCALFAGLVVFELRWISFDIAEWIVTGLYIAGLVTGAMAALAELWRIFAALLATAMVAGTVFLPVPKGGEDASRESNQWSVAVTVMDSNYYALPGALAHCAVLMSWERELAMDLTTARMTDEAGKTEPWTFTEDRRLKVVICNALKEQSDGNAGYPLQSAAIPVLNQGSNEVRITLTERPHPDVAYVVVGLPEPRANWYYLDFELWAGSPPGDVPFGTSSGWRSPLDRKSWQGLKHGGFEVRRGQPTQDLYLRLRYEGPSNSQGTGPPRVEVLNYRVGDVALGGRRRMNLSVPWAR